jgi:hypothetical protein
VVRPVILRENAGAFIQERALYGIDRYEDSDAQTGGEIL